MSSKHTFGGIVCLKVGDCLYLSRYSIVFNANSLSRSRKFLLKRNTLFIHVFLAMEILEILCVIIVFFYHHVLEEMIASLCIYLIFL